MVFLVRCETHHALISWSLTITLQSGLFSSIVASFIIEIYKNLIPANGGTPPSIAVRINVVLFLSFFLSVVSAVSCALIQQWCNEYLMFAYPRGAPHECGRVRTYLFNGFRMGSFMYGIQVFLHASVFLFFWAISDFFYTVYRPFGLVIRYTLVAAATVYFILSISPVVFSNSPFGTPVTPPLRAAGIIFRIIIRSPLLFAQWYRGGKKALHLTGLPYYHGIRFDRARFYLTKANKWAKHLEPYAMTWLFTCSDISDADMDKFLEGLPGYMGSNHTKEDYLDTYLTEEPILSRIKEHFMTCATSVELSDNAIFARASSCVKTLSGIFRYSRERKEGFPGKLKEESELQKKYIQDLIYDLRKLCDGRDPTIALRSSCIRALAVQGFLSLVALQDGTTDVLPFYAPLIPIYEFFFPFDKTDIIRLQLDHGIQRRNEESRRLWKNLMHDGPLVNLTKLAQGILRGEYASPESLSICWKTLDKLLEQLLTTHPDPNKLTPAQIDFDNLHESACAYVRDGERSFRVTRLLDILDKVARGRRLLIMFSGHTKFHNRAVVFEKEYLQNGNFLEAFACNLPHFISDNPLKVCRDLMEKAVRHDDLWTSLQVNICNAQRSDSPIPDKLRVFESCCTVIDRALSVLEGSQEVDWRSPEFGSLVKHFELFITHYFQGTFMGRATSFRIGVIRARYCHAILGQFSNDLERESTVSFRSQWDVASLARLAVTLGLRDEDDPEFWNSHISGGYVEAGSAEKAVKIIKLAERDGPLLILCYLGRLALAAVPRDQSGVGLKDMENALNLQKKVIENARLPFNRASDTVLGELGRLREQVKELCRKSSGEDKGMLRQLLLVIGDAFNANYASEEGPSSSELANEQAPDIPAAVDPTSSLGRSSGIPNLPSNPSSAPESTAATIVGQSTDTETGEGEDDFIRASPYYFLELLLTFGQRVQVLQIEF